MDQATFNKLLTVGVQNGASDIHFRPGDPPIYRVNGVLRPLKMEKLHPDHTRQVALHVIGDPLTKSQIDNVQEYDTSYGLAGVARFRVNIYRQRGTLACILRIIPDEIPSIDGLGLPQVLKTIAANDRGLVLVTGATRWNVVPLQNDQELDSRRSTGAVYWEGAVTIQQNGRRVGRGYLEMTGYVQAMKL